MIDWLRRDMQEPAVTLDLRGEQRTLPIAIRRHPRARRLTMRLAPDGSEVRLTLPRWGRTREAVEFAQSRKDWLEAQLSKLPRPAPPLAGGSLFYRGQELTIHWDESAPRRPLRDEGTVRLGGPRDKIAPRLQRWLEGEALALMGKDLPHYCRRAGQDVPALRLSRARQRWGSCSGDGMIRLNWRLVQAPDAVRRSVVAHEVAHLVHFDHSPAFHALLGELYEGDIRAANRWLKQHGRSLYAQFG